MPSACSRPCDQFDVVPGGAHGGGDGRAADPDLQRLLAGDGVRPGGERAVRGSRRIGGTNGRDSAVIPPAAVSSSRSGPSAADHPDLQDAFGVGALVAVRDEVVVDVERAGPGVVPVDPQRGRAVADGRLQQVVGQPGALVGLPDVDGVELAVGRRILVPGRDRRSRCRSPRRPPRPGSGRRPRTRSPCGGGWPSAATSNRRIARPPTGTPRTPRASRPGGRPRTPRRPPAARGGQGRLGPCVHLSGCANDVRPGGQVLTVSARHTCATGRHHPG